jgi:sialic acid synthase SpsE
MKLAKQMIKSAKEAGASLSKFQLYDAEEDKGKPHYEWVKKAELNFVQAKELFNYGESIGMEIFFSVFHPMYVEWCERIGVKRYKLACDFSDEATIWAVLNTRKPFYCSVLVNGRKWAVQNLLCVPSYPAHPSDLHLNLLDYFSGYSDHTIGLDACKIALARGAGIIEKHFILDRSIPSPEKDWAMDLKDLIELVRFEKVCQESL